jgi:hypothetical protein
LVLICAASARATLYSFYNITGNSAVNVATAGQYSVDVTSYSATQVLFTFMNASGGAASSIQDIYFDDGTLLGIAALIETPPSVDFDQMVSPPDLPGGETLDPDFVVTQGFAADASTPGPIARGINPGESLGIVFDLQSGGMLQDVLDELNDGTLRIGIHVQGFANGGSESFVNVPVPAPAAAGLGALGLLVVGWARRRYS